MRRSLVTAALVLAAGALYFVGCTDNSQMPTEPPSFHKGGVPAPQARINALIRDAFSSNADRNDAQKQMARIKNALARGDIAEGQALTLALIDFVREHGDDINPAADLTAELLAFAQISGTAGVVGSSEAELVSPDEQAALFIPEGALSDEVLISFFKKDQPCFPTDEIPAGEQFDDCYTFQPEGLVFDELVRVEVCLDLPVGTDDFNNARLHGRDEPGPPVVLPEEEHELIDCEFPVFASIGSSGLERFARAGFNRLMSLFSPEPLFAANRLLLVKRLGGTRGSFTDIGWALPQVPEGVVSWWPGEGNYFDVMGGNHGTTGVVDPVGFVPGISGDAFEFTGSPDEIIGFPQENIDELQQLTVANWVKLDPSGPVDEVQRFVTLMHEKAVLRQEGSASESRILHFYMNFSPETAPDWDMRHIWYEGLEAGCFNHVAGTYDGSVMRLYLNGVLVGTNPVIGTVNSDGGGGHFSNAPEPLFGLLDEVQVYNRALSETEIQEIFEAGGNGDVCPLPPPPPITDLIAFLTNRDGGDQEIYVMNPDGTNQTNLTNSLGSDAFPTWSPDRSQIAFATSRDENFEIYVMNADGSGQTNLTNDLAVDNVPSWSPTGSKIAFLTTRTGDTEIFIMNPDGTDQVNVSSYSTANETWPTWSPDGSRIAFVSDRDGDREIYVMNADGTGQTNLTDNSADDANPAWSPDGNKIAFSTDRDGNHEIYLMNPDGTGIQRITNDLALDDTPTWAPSGPVIAFRRWYLGAGEIFRMNLDGTGLQNLTNTVVANEFGAAWKN